jgi:hypothetical protein
MGEPVPDSKTPALVAVAFVLIGVVLAVLAHAGIVGGLVAAAGAIPGCVGMWKGIQQETQTTLAISVATVLLALAVGAVLLVLGIIHHL